MQKVLQILKDKQAEKEVSITTYKTFLFDKRQHSQVKVQNNQAFETKCSNSLPNERAEQIRKSLNQLGLELDFTQQVAEGQNMPQFKDLHKVFTEEQAQLTHQPGEVLLVDVWATWCGPCQRPMQHNQEMLYKNQEKWKGKVRIVAVSVDDEKEIIQKRVNTKGWTKIEHLTLLGWKGDHPLIQNFKVQGIPFVFLVDKQGKIDYTGHPMQTDLQKRINELLQRESIQANTKVEVEKESSQQKFLTVTKNIEVLQKVLSKENLQKRFDKADLFSVSSNGKMKIIRGSLEQIEFTLKVSTYEDTPEVIQEFKELLKDVDPTIYKVEQNLVKFEKQPSIENVQCADCKTKLSYPCYWCKWDKTPNTFRCRDCVQKKPTQEGKHYSYLNNSVLLTGEWKRIAVKNLGKNIQPVDIAQVSAPNQFGCNGCGNCPNTIGEARNICLGCRSDPNYQGDYVDFCQQCFNKLLNGDQNVKESLKADRHNENHPWLRILYNCEGYYNF